VGPPAPVARRGALKACTQAIVQLHTLLDTSPEVVRARFSGHTAADGGDHSSSPAPGPSDRTRGGGHRSHSSPAPRQLAHRLPRDRGGRRGAKGMDLTIRIRWKVPSARSWIPMACLLTAMASLVVEGLQLWVVLHQHG
jgi:hypothetical protein